jgi:fatty-acyl-CoA synthase
MTSAQMAAGPYDRDLDKNDANFVPLTPLTFLARSASIYPDHLAVIYGDVRRTWSESYARCRQLASALKNRGIDAGDTVAVIAPNIPELFEAHFGIPMAGAVLNAINTRLDAEIIAFILQHGEAKALIVDAELSKAVDDALSRLAEKPLIIDIVDPTFTGGKRLGSITYEELLAEGDPEYAWKNPDDEWQAISLNYTSGTTGNPKGVVYHHRGAHLNAVSMALDWQMQRHPVYLWTLPMFHCNGWCFPWTLAVVAGTSVCLRQVREEPIFDAIREHKVTHFCGAPIVLNLMNNAPPEMWNGIEQKVHVMTAGAAPPAAVIERMEAAGFEVTHVYGLTEVYGPNTICVWHDRWNDLPINEKASLKARQGVRNHMAEDWLVADAITGEPVPKDGETMGEIFLRGNNVMKGYLKNPSATLEAFEGGWFRSGDLAVWYEDGYIEIKDRSKDIIISGGENISSLEIEEVLYRHPAVMEAAVVAKANEKWGETPCAFVNLKADAEVSEDEIITYCRERLARFKVPKDVVFGELPKTSTGKIQKFELRKLAEEIPEKAAS